MITIDFKLDEDFFNKTVKVEIPLRKFALEVKKSIESDLKGSRSFDGSGLAPLNKKYAERKRKKLGHSRIFDGFRKGKAKLINSVIVNKISNDEYDITITDANKDIMYWLQTGAPPMNGKRKGFGINDNKVNAIFSKLDKEIKLTYV